MTKIRVNLIACRQRESIFSFFSCYLAFRVFHFRRLPSTSTLDSTRLVCNIVAPVSFGACVSPIYDPWKIIPKIHPFHPFRISPALSPFSHPLIVFVHFFFSFRFFFRRLRRFPFFCSNATHQHFSSSVPLSFHSLAAISSIPSATF